MIDFTNILHIIHSCVIVFPQENASKTADVNDHQDAIVCIGTTYYIKHACTRNEPLLAGSNQSIKVLLNGHCMRADSAYLSKHCLYNIITRDFM